jgi:hypothetical protein
MALTMSRSEKSAEIFELACAIRAATIAPARDGELNLAEIINAFGQAFASILVGAYGNKNREVVLTTFPDLVRTYFPQWEAIYASITPPEESGGSFAKSE